MGEWPKAAEPVCSSLLQFATAGQPERGTILPKVPKEVWDTLQRLESKQGISLGTLTNVFAKAEHPTGGTPGRSRKGNSLKKTNI